MFACCCVPDGKNNGGSKRYSRKREPSFPKSDTFPGPRRANPQKGKNFDKRPAQRGGRQYGVTGGGRREEVGPRSAPERVRGIPSSVDVTLSLSVPPQVAETRRAEFSPAQFAGPKKISLNHLLNFTFEPRGAGLLDGGPSGWGRRNKWGHKHKPFNKELFLQAKYGARRPPVQSDRERNQNPELVLLYHLSLSLSLSQLPVCGD